MDMSNLSTTESSQDEEGYDSSLDSCSSLTTGNHQEVNSSMTDSIETESGQQLLNKTIQILNKKIHHNNQLEASGSPTNLAVQSHQQIIEITKVSYRDYFVRIYTDSKKPGRFYFDPIVQLDRKSIVHESHALLKQEIVRFTLQMWNEDLRSKVLRRLRHLFNVNIQEDDVHVMPYEELQLISKSGSMNQESFKLMDRPKSYFRLNENISFYFLCDSFSTANTLAGDFRRNTEFILENWELSLKCKRFSNNPEEMFTFNVSTFPAVELENDQPSSADFQSGMLNSIHRNLASTVPVFSVHRNGLPSTSAGQYLSFSGFDFESQSEQGDFNLSTGIFTAKSSGIYQFIFSAHVNIDSDNCNTLIELKVDDISKAESLSQSATETDAYYPAVISALVPLKTGQKVGVYLASGKIWEKKPTYTTRFSAILFAN